MSILQLPPKVHCSWVELNSYKYGLLVISIVTGDNKSHWSGLTHHWCPLQVLQNRGILAASRSHHWGHRIRALCVWCEEGGELWEAGGVGYAVCWQAVQDPAWGIGGRWRVQGWERRWSSLWCGLLSAQVEKESKEWQSRVQWERSQREALSRGMVDLKRMQDKLQQVSLH